MKVTAKSAIGSMSHSFMNNSNKSKIILTKIKPSLNGICVYSTITFTIKNNIKCNLSYSQLASSNDSCSYMRFNWRPHK